MSVDWGLRYQTGDTPWDKGMHHPEFEHLFADLNDDLEKCDRILVPGCGYGYDAAKLVEMTRAEVVGLDLADEAIEGARERHSHPRLQWRVGDLFALDEPFDAVVEHTCFCAIPPEMRATYAATMSRIVRPGGHFLGVFFLNPDHDPSEGPPFGVALDELHQFFGGDFELRHSNRPRATFDSRAGEGREQSMVWRRL